MRSRLGRVAVGMLAACAPCACSVAVPAGSGTGPDVGSTPAVVAPPVVPRLPANGPVDYQIGGAYDPAAAVAVVSRDRHDSPAAGRFSVCYLNAFQTQPEEKRFWMNKAHRNLLVKKKGKVVGDPNWPGEYLLDTSTAAKRRALAAIVGPWIDSCADRGFQAVEPDNLDSWTRSKKVLDRADNLAFAATLVRRAHVLGLAVAQKNTGELGSSGQRTVGFDFAIAEECQVYRECNDYTDVYGDQVIEVEYTDNPRRAFTEACATRGARISVVLRDRGVVARGQKSYHYQEC